MPNPRLCLCHPLCLYACQIFTDEIIVCQVRVSFEDAVELLALTLGEHLVGIEAPIALEQSLAAQDLVNAGDATCEAVRGVKDSRIGIGFIVPHVCSGYTEMFAMT